MNPEPHLERERSACKERFKLGSPFSSPLLLTVCGKRQLRCQEPWTRGLYQNREGKINIILAWSRIIVESFRVLHLCLGTVALCLLDASTAVMVMAN